MECNELSSDSLQKEISLEQRGISSKKKKIQKEIAISKQKAIEARKKAKEIEKEYSNTSWIHFIKRRKLKKAREEAERELLYANHEAIMDMFGILGRIIEFVLLCFMIPVALIQNLRKWIKDSFSRRDEVYVNMCKNMGEIVEHASQKKQSYSFKNISICFIFLFICGFIYINDFRTEHNQTLAVYDEKISNLQAEFSGVIESQKKEIEELRTKILAQEKLVSENLNKNQNDSIMQSKEQDVLFQENNDGQELFSEKNDSPIDVLNTADDNPVLPDSFDNETVESDIQSMQSTDNNMENDIGKDESLDVVEMNSTENENIDSLSSAL